MPSSPRTQPTIVCQEAMPVAMSQIAAAAVIKVPADQSTIQAAINAAGAGDEVLEDGDTIYLTVADSDGNMVSLIQSNYRGMGSGMTPGDLGFVLQNRAELFSLEEGHANVLEPGKPLVSSPLAGCPYDDHTVLEWAARRPTGWRLIYARQAAQPLPGCGEYCIGNSRGNNGGGRFADTGGRFGGRHDVNFNLGHLVDTQCKVIVKV